MKKTILFTAITLTVVILVSLIPFFLVKTGGFTGNDWKESDEFSLESVIDFKVKGESAKILHMSDFHFSALFGSLNNKNYEMLDKVLEIEKPDLVAITGDLNIALLNGVMLDRFGKYMDSKKVYWTYSLGNHDCQFGLGEYRYIQRLSNFEYCLYKVGPTNLGSYLNYFVRVLNCNDEVLSTLSIINNGNSIISDNLKNWYKWNIEGLNKAQNCMIENLMFVHIPFEVMNKYAETPNEKISIMDCDNNITKLIEELDTTHYVFNGHDHLNNFEFSYNNVNYYSTPSFGFCGYGRTDIERGLRVITISDKIEVELKGQSDYGF